MLISGSLFKSKGFRREISLIVPLVLTAFTHLWNPIGFPGVHYDEAIYTERAVRLLEGLGPQDPTWRYDHPFFGQILLGSIFSITQPILIRYILTLLAITRR